jgi:hypothetical protein
VSSEKQSFSPKPDWAMAARGSDGDGAAAVSLIPKKISWVRYFVIGGFIIFVIAAILICFFLVQYLKPNDLPLTNPTVPNNSTKDPLVHLDFDEISEGVSFFNDTLFVYSIPSPIDLPMCHVVFMKAK